MTARPALDVAVAAGLVAALVGAVGAADWFAWLIEINRETMSLATGAIAGRQGLVLVEVLLALGWSVAALWLATMSTGAAAAGAFVLALTRASASGVLISLHWDEAWYFILGRTGPKVVLLLAVVQIGALVWAGVQGARKVS